MKGNPVTIVKNGNLMNIDEENLRKNDTVVLQTGDIVPADLKLTEATGLEVDEFELTGEIMPVVKKANNRNAMIYMGSRIIKGMGKGLVVATGGQTEYGRILKQTLEQNKTYRFPTFKKKYLILVSLLLPAFTIQLVQLKNSILVIVFYLLLSTIFILLQNTELFRYLLISREMKNCERLNIQIRDARALESINEIDILCFDKTGVLTTRQMEIKNIYYADGTLRSSNLSNKERTAYLIKIACALCNDVLFFEKMNLTNPVDKALLSFAEKNGMNIKEMLLESRRIYDKPFDSENRHMACGYELKDGQVYYFAKGDPDVIIKMCNSYITKDGTEKKVDFDFRLFNKSIIDAINQGGTAIALAYAPGIFNKPPGEYTFLCLLQLENSLQQGVHTTIRKATEKGIRSIMLTGDRAETALKVSEACGITKDSRLCLVGRAIERMALSEVGRQSEYCSVFARLLPSQKGIIIRLLQQRGHYIAMVGDGPNDGIALKVADIGISFVENSSPIARKLSNILIHEIADLERLIKGSNRIKRRLKYLMLFRIVVLAILLLGLYMFVMTSPNIPLPF